jgi:predicted nucleic acid-binding protein
MTFAAIPAGESVFIDANVFVYEFTPHATFGPSSRDLLKRVEVGDLKGYTSSHALHDAAHRLMTLEACRTFGWPYSGIVRRLCRSPLEVQKLQGFQAAVDRVPAIGVQVLSVSVEHVLLAARLSKAHGLLSGDALVLAMMQSHGIRHLASGDADFDRVPGITRYSPV